MSALLTQATLVTTSDLYTDILRDLHVLSPQTWCDLLRSVYNNSTLLWPKESSWSKNKHMQCAFSDLWMSCSPQLCHYLWVSSLARHNWLPRDLGIVNKFGFDPKLYCFSASPLRTKCQWCSLSRSCLVWVHCVHLPLLTPFYLCCLFIYLFIFASTC